MALLAAAMRGRCSFFETLRGSSAAAADPAAPGGGGIACSSADMPSAHQWPCGDMALNLAAEPPRGLPAACAEPGRDGSGKAPLEVSGDSAGQAPRAAGAAAGAAQGAPAAWGSCSARTGCAAAGAAQTPGRSPGPAAAVAHPPAAPGSARSASAAGAHGAMRRPFAAMPRQRSADLCIPAEEEAFLRSLGWQECKDEAEGANSHPVPTAALVLGHFLFVSCKAFLHDVGQSRQALASAAPGTRA